MFRIYGTCSVLLLVGHTLPYVLYESFIYIRTRRCDGGYNFENSLDLYIAKAVLLVNS